MRLIAVFIFFSASMVFGMDRPLRKGQIQLTLSYQTLDADRYFNLDEIAVPIVVSELGQSQSTDYSRTRTRFQLTYGIRNNTSLVIGGAYRSHELDGLVDQSGIGDYTIGVRRLVNAFGDSSWFTVEAGAVLGGSGNDEPLPLSADETDWYTVAGYSQDFYPRGGFEMDFGYRFRGGPYEDEYFFNTSLAVGLGNLALAKATYRVAESKDQEVYEYGFLVQPQDRGAQIWGLELSRQISAAWEVKVAWQQMHAGRHQYQTRGLDVSVSWIF